MQPCEVSREACCCSLRIYCAEQKDRMTECTLSIHKRSCSWGGLLSVSIILWLWCRDDRQPISGLAGLNWCCLVQLVLCGE